MVAKGDGIAAIACLLAFIADHGGPFTGFTPIAIRRLTISRRRPVVKRFGPARAGGDVSGSCWTGTERSTLATARSLAAPDRGGPARATRRRTRPARPREAHFTHPRHSAALAAGDNAKTGLNRDSFGTVAHPAAPPDGRASSHWTRSGRGAAANHASRPERRDEHVVTVLVLAVAGRRQRGVRLAGFDRAAGRGHSCRDELPARWAAPGPSDAFPADLPLSSAGEARESRCAAAPASLSRAPVSPPDRRASRRREREAAEERRRGASCDA